MLRIFICVKQVPDAAAVEIDPETNTLKREGVESVVNPLDWYAVEEALRIKATLPSEPIETVAITMGPPQAADALREVLAVGIDRAVLVSDRAFAGADTWATSYALAKAMAAVGDPWLILTGKQAIDGDTAQVGPEIAVHLDLPQAMFVRRIRSVTKDFAIVERLTDNGCDVLKVKLPAVMSVLKDINEPRKKNLFDLKRGMSAEIPALTAKGISADLTQIGLDGSPTRVVEIFSPDSARVCRRYGGTPETSSGDLDSGVSAVIQLLQTE
ncbi:MAG: electron transfer flavoprotein subunit beta/FixA family protein [Planctomycetota bacterium]